MMSVGAERDPYLQAYIQARMKNHVEEVKLQKVLANLEVGRRIKKIMLNMELFEDRKVAHKLKQEASDAETSKKKAMTKYLHSQKKSHRLKKDTFYPPAMTTHSLNASLTAETLDIPTTAPTSGTTKRQAVYPVTKGNCRNNVSPNVSMIKIDKNIDIRRLSSVDNLNNSVSIPSTTATTSTNLAVKVRELTTPFRREQLGSVFHNNASNSSANATRTDEKLPSAYRRSHTVSQLSTPAVQIEVLDPEGMKTPATIPMRRHKRTTDNRSERTLPTILHTTGTQPGLVSNTGRPQTSKLWPGDPDAIRSVRRERRKPEEMLSLVKNGEEARRMIRDMPPTCSKNCSKPDILQELGRSYTDLPNLLPAIEKARHELAQKDAATRDVPPDHDFGEDGGPKEAMPVSQIQYMALRSMGGVRRNSVIA